MLLIDLAWSLIYVGILTCCFDTIELLNDSIVLGGFLNMKVLIDIVWCMGHIWLTVCELIKFKSQKNKDYSDLKNIIVESGQNFAHVTTAELSWHEQNSDMIELL